MKRFIVKMSVMVILMISATAVYAQNGPTGTGFLRPEFEYERSTNKVIEHFETAMKNAFGKGDLSGFTRDRDQMHAASAVKTVETIGKWFKDQSGNEHLTGLQIAEMFDNGSVTYDEVGPSYWDDHLSAYLKLGTGELCWWKPTTSSLFQWRKIWVIAHFHFPGKIVDLIANCANLSRGYETSDANEYSTSKTTQTSGNATANATATVSVVLQKPDPYQALDQRNGQRNGKFPTIAKVAIVVVVLAVVTKCFIIPALKKAAEKDNNYDTGFQGGSGPTPTKGGEGDPHTY